MTKHAALIARLCEASEGSAELSREVREALGGTWSANEPCLTTDLSAAWEEARKKYSEIALVRNRHGECSAELWVPGGEIGTRQVALVYGKCEECALVAAILAAEGER